MGLNVIDKKIILKERIGIPRSGEFVRVGVPFAKGELQSTEGLSVVTPEGEAQPLQAAPLSRWKDGSVKWALLDFAASVPPWGRMIYRLIDNRDPSQNAVSGIQVTIGVDSWLVNTGTAVFSVDARVFRPFLSVKSANDELLSKEGTCALLTAENERLIPYVESVAMETEGPLRVILSVRGRFGEARKETARFSSKLHFFAGSSRALLEFTIHNPNPARHPGGLWDLGDPASLLFRELAFEFHFPEGNVKDIFCSPEPGAEPVCCGDPAERLSIYQESSGGENWHSPTHRNKNGVVSFTIRGYEIRSGEKRIATGARATPVIWGGSGRKGFSAMLPRFWQEFPKAFEANRRSMKIALFPRRFPDLHELQGGEQKTHMIYLDFAALPGDLEWSRAPLAATASPEVVRQAKVVPDLPPIQNGESGECDLVDRFISGPDEFLRKREALDEYGWRNFGDLYADHEAVYHKGAERFVSHYNNQYDPCAGMYRKFLATGDPLWGELASDLARHVLDIDIYHTEGDREEYNNGLFWHTDHYIPAGLSTHRSFSREHLQIKDPRFCGGGPAAEHCYTTGLMLHYFLTGDRTFRDSVIGLAEWCYHSISGSQPVLATVKRAGRYLALLRNAGKDNKMAFPRYPLSRGTGNAINSCLDAYEVSGDRKFLDRAEELIRGALHPHDDINARNLLDAEAAWSYTVLLVAVAKFLGKLEELEEFNEGYVYARASLLAYAEWMVQHEYPYLDKPEILEYPNETWPAQDLRKIVVFYHAARHAETERREAFLSRGRFFYNTASEELARHSTSIFTRPLALMLQNGWVGASLEGIDSVASVPAHPELTFGKPTPHLCIRTVVARIGWELGRAVRETSLRRELAWLKARLQS